jgi:hypothetical protein
LRLDLRAAVPGLPVELSDPTALDQLSLTVLVDLRRQIRHLDAEVDGAIARRAPLEPGQPGPDAVLGVEEAARRLDTSADSLYRKHKRLRLGYKDPLDGRLKFTQQEIADYIRRQRRS